MKIIPERLRAH